MFCKVIFFDYFRSFVYVLRLKLEMFYLKISYERIVFIFYRGMNFEYNRGYLYV